jgi:FkbM family methyltransferase
MTASIKRLARSSIRFAVRTLGGTRLGRVVCEEVIDHSMARTSSVTHAGTQLSFAVPNALNQFRADSFATKEPETLAWIDSIPRGSVLWDVGANVGLYSCYAARTRDCRVIAFEPSVFNLELLARNIFLNGLTDKVTIMPLPLFANVAQSTLNMTSMQWGGALSSFGVGHGFDGQALAKVFEFRTVGLSMDDCVARLDIPAPEYIKMDVDGIEHLILGAAPRALAGVRGVAVEINEAFTQQAEESRRALEGAGLRFVRKAHSDMIEANPTFNRTFNQVWER